MTLILEWTISNVVVATALALLAASVGRVATRPQITHALWVLVLIKLITPPLLPIPVLRTPSAPVALQPPGKPTPNSMPELQPETSTTAAPRNNEPQTEPEQTPLPVDISGARSNTEISHNQSPAFISPVVPLRLLVGVWITGALLWFLLAATRLLRFGRVLRYANPATCDIDTEVKAIASKFGLRTVPRVLMVDGTVPPCSGALAPGPVWFFPTRCSTGSSDGNEPD